MNDNFDSELLSLTAAASIAIKRILDDEGLSADTRLRIKVVGGGCSGFAYDMAFDEIDQAGTARPATNDDPVSAQDRLIVCDDVHLVVDEVSLMYLFGTTIDYVEELVGTGFKFNNPNSSTCACGQSFSPNN